MYFLQIIKMFYAFRRMSRVLEKLSAQITRSKYIIYISIRELITSRVKHLTEFLVENPSHTDYKKMIYFASGLLKYLMRVPTWFSVHPNCNNMLPLSHDVLQNHSCAIKIHFSSVLVGFQLASSGEMSCDTCCSCCHIFQLGSPGILQKGKGRSSFKQNGDYKLPLQHVFGITCLVCK